MKCPKCGTRIKNPVSQAGGATERPRTIPPEQQARMQKTRLRNRLALAYRRAVEQQMEDETK